MTTNKLSLQDWYIENKQDVDDEFDWWWFGYGSMLEAGKTKAEIEAKKAEIYAQIAERLYNGESI